MRDYITLGGTPYDEDCAQVGSENYRQRAMLECRLYKAMLCDLFPNIPDSCEFKVKAFPHDFGTYHEVCIMYDSDDEKACEFAFSVENNLPANWDDNARKELNL